MEYVIWISLYVLVSAAICTAKRFLYVKRNGLSEEATPALKAYALLALLGWFLLPCIVYYIIVGEPVPSNEVETPLGTGPYGPYFD